MQLKVNKIIFSQTLKPTLIQATKKIKSSIEWELEAFKGLNTIFNQNTHKLQKSTKCFKQKQ